MGSDLSIPCCATSGDETVNFPPSPTGEPGPPELPPDGPSSPTSDTAAEMSSKLSDSQLVWRAKRQQLNRADLLGLDNRGAGSPTSGNHVPGSSRSLRSPGGPSVYRPCHVK